VGRTPLKDMVVILPGITGSVLERDNKEIWGGSPGAIIRALLSRGGSWKDLELPDDGGVEATKVIRDVHIVPGLHKIDGYTALIEAVEKEFEIRQGLGGDSEATNFVEFPYDWRQDNRLSAERLEEVVGEKLKRWRQASGATDAKAILLAHSMGGLVSRYWLECLGGWPDCRALFTFGTPYRGSLDSLGYLVNGYRKAVLDLSKMMRSLPSAHQLLPIYRAVAVDGSVRRVREIPDLPGIDPGLARDATKFHDEIAAAVDRNREEAGSPADPYLLVPIVGTRQPTLQSATFAAGRLTVGGAVPEGIDSLLGGGDGTVPRVSATPLELSDKHRETFRPERHSSLQANRAVLEDVIDRIRDLQARGLGEVRAVEATAEGKTALSVDVDDAYLPEEPVEVRARVLGAEAVLGDLEASLEPLAGAAAPRVERMQEREGEWRLAARLDPGDYRVTVRMAGGGPLRPPDVHDVFCVLPDEA
jgi:hypothetical protein